MNDINSLVAECTQIFGAVSVLAVSVTGFLLGRRWLFKAGKEEFDNASYDNSDPHGRLSRAAYRSMNRKNTW